MFVFINFVLSDIINQSYTREQGLLLHFVGKDLQDFGSDLIQELSLAGTDLFKMGGA